MAGVGNAVVDVLPALTASGITRDSQPHGQGFLVRRDCLPQNGCPYCTRGFLTPARSVSRRKPDSHAPHGIYHNKHLQFSGLVLEYFTQQAFLLEPLISVFQGSYRVRRLSGCLMCFRHHVIKYTSFLFWFQYPARNSSPVNPAGYNGR